MNIQTQNIEALFSQQELQAKKAAAQKNANNAGFAATLAEQATQSPLGGAENGTVQTHLNQGIQASLAQQLLVNGVENIAASSAGQSPEVKQTLGQTSRALDMLDLYAQKLRAPSNDGNLRDAYALLEGIEAQVSTLKANNKQTLEQNPDLADLVNELEILSTTEKFKFNRGDYMS